MRIGNGVEVLEQFHDSELIGIKFGPNLLSALALLETSADSGGTKLYRLRLEGILRFEFETLGSGEKDDYDIPAQIYDVYIDWASAESERWNRRLAAVANSPDTPATVIHIILASSFNRGWGKNEALEGLSIVCRRYFIEEVRGAGDKARRAVL